MYKYTGFQNNIANAEWDLILDAELYTARQSKTVNVESVLFYN